MENNVILIIEDNKTIRMYQAATLEKLGLTVVSVENLDEAKLLLKQYGKEIVLAVVDINLPECEDCALDYLLKRNIPSIAMTGSFHLELHNKIINKNIIDYIILEDDNNLELLSSIVKRIISNQHTKILIVDDSKTSRMKLKTFLIHQNFTVLEAENGKEALDLIRRHNDIKVTLIDYEMPGMNGAELARKIRKRHARTEMAILAISIHSEPLITVEFLKAGANDFITKPFIKEEVSARIGVNLDIISMHTKVNEEKQEKEKANLKIEKLNASLEEKVSQQVGEIQKSKVLFETVFETVKDGIAILDLDSNFQLVNKAYEKITGYTKEELYKMSCVDMSVPETAEASRKAFEITIEKEHYEGLLKQCVRKDNKIIDVRIELILMPDKKSILIVTKDITAENRYKKEKKIQDEKMLHIN